MIAFRECPRNTKECSPPPTQVISRCSVPQAAATAFTLRHGRCPSAATSAGVCSPQHKGPLVPFPCTGRLKTQPPQLYSHSSEKNDLPAASAPDKHNFGIVFPLSQHWSSHDAASHKPPQLHSHSVPPSRNVGRGMQSATQRTARPLPSRRLSTFPASRESARVPSRF